MTVYAVFGDCDASTKLVTAALNDQLEAHLLDTPNDDFWLCLGIRNPMLGVYAAIMKWAAKNEIYVAAFANFNLDTEIHGVAEFAKSDRFMLDCVEKCFTEEKSAAKVYALVGDNPPPTDVARALARAYDSGMEVRDLAEAGLTYLRPSDDPLPRKEIAIMADEDEGLTLEELAEIADDPDHDDCAEAQEVLTEAAGEAGLDPDEYPTWAELAEALAEAGVGGGEEEAEEDASGDGQWSAEELDAMSLPELRKLAKASGIADHDTKRKNTIIRELVEGGAEAVAEEAEEAPAKAAPKAKAPSKSGDAPTDAEIAEAVRTILRALG